MPIWLHHTVQCINHYWFMNCRLIRFFSIRVHQQTYLQNFCMCLFVFVWNIVYYIDFVLVLFLLISYCPCDIFYAYCYSLCRNKMFYQTCIFVVSDHHSDFRRMQRVSVRVVPDIRLNCWTNDANFERANFFFRIFSLSIK